MEQFYQIYDANLHFQLINSYPFVIIVYVAVAFNIISLILMTFPEYAAKFAYFLSVLDSFFLAIYMVEAMIKITALGWSYFRNGWNILDFLILITSWVDFVGNFVTASSSGDNALKVLRTFRVLRALRALRMLR